jgi:muramoyltetrapeptide carboxypeptidase
MFKNLLKNKIAIVFPASDFLATEIDNLDIFLANNQLEYCYFFDRSDAVNDLSLADDFANRSPQKRFNELSSAINNDECSIIWVGRGGYGSAELLPMLYRMPRPKQQKIIIGFSDITAINLFFIRQWNWQVISAPMLLQLVNCSISNFATRQIVDLVNRNVANLCYDINLVNADYCQEKQINTTIKSTIIGGCLSVVASHFGTKNTISWQNQILFLEDEGESGERLDRYFQQILTIIIETGKFPAAILLGNFNQENQHGKINRLNIAKAVDKFANKILANNLPIPLWQDSKGILGHSFEMMPLVLNFKANIVKKDEHWQITQELI